MSRLILLLGGAVGILALLRPEVQGAGPAEQKATVSRLIAQLGSERFSEREEACRQLEALAEVALPMLRQARPHPDLEVRRRVAELLQALDLRFESRRLLEPKRLRLVVKDLPIPDAVEELARQTGGRIEIRGNQDRLRQRRVSVETGDTTFWDALQRLCKETGLRESPTLPLHVPTSELFDRNDRYVIMDGSIFAQSPGSEGPFYLEEGALPLLPATRVGALAIRALPPSGSAPLVPNSDSLLPLTLEVKPDPSIDWQCLVTMRIDRAIDDHGQLLHAYAPFVAGSFRPPKFDGRALLIHDSDLELPTNAGLRQVSLALRPAKLPSRRLRELHGSLAARIRPPVEPLVAAENVLEAKGRRFTGPDGTVLTVSSVTEDEPGAYEMKVEVAEPPIVLDFELPFFRIMNPRRRMVVTGTQLLSAAERASLFTLLDARGKPLTMATGNRGANKNGSIKLFTLVFQAGREQGPPTRLIYNARRMALVEVPFVLKDVPLIP